MTPNEHYQHARAATAKLEAPLADLLRDYPDLTEGSTPEEWAQKFTRLMAQTMHTNWLIARVPPNNA